MTRGVVLAAILLSQGCWADFPGSRFLQDAAPDADARSAWDSWPGGEAPLPDTPAPSLCSSDQDCHGYDCNTGICRTTCFQTSHCASGYLCSSAQACVKAIPCTSDAPCGGYDCYNGTCRVRCERNQHCAQGYHCQSSACVAN